MLRWGCQVFFLEIRKTFAYRVDFWLQFVLSVLAHIGVAYYLWDAVFTYNNTSSMRGYSFKSLMFYYVMVPLINRMILGPGLGKIAHEIYDGALTKYLVYPVSFFLYKYIQYASTTLVYILQLFITIGFFIFFFGKPDDIIISGSSLLMWLLAVITGGLLAFSISAALEMIAFWVDHVWSLIIMFRFIVSLLGGAMIPIAFFPETVTDILKFLPFASFASWPVRSFMGKVTWPEFGFTFFITIFWIVTFTAICTWIWNKGKYQYTGVGI